MKPRVLVMTDAYLPGYLAGGPIRSIAGLADSLGDDFEWAVLTSDRDFGCSTPYQNIKSAEWNAVGATKVFYIKPGLASYLSMLREIRTTPHEILYLNSCFSPKFSIFPLLARKLRLIPRRPVLVAPRGEFSSGAIQLKSLKKRLFLFFARMVGLHADANWHASTEYERADIARETGAAMERILVARNLVAPRRANDRFVNSGHVSDVLRVCFLSRLSRKKNLDYALSVLSGVDQPVRLSIYGPREDLAYWHECEGLISELPGNIEVVYEGGVPNEEVIDTIARHDLFFLPTRGENFGHVLLEAWSAGVPVLTSDQTPWRQLESEGVGWTIPLTEPQRFVEVIGDVSKWTSQQHSDCRSKCIAFAREHSLDGSAIEANRKMFSQVLVGLSD